VVVFKEKMMVNGNKEILERYLEDKEKSNLE